MQNLKLIETIRSQCLKDSNFFIENFIKVYEKGGQMNKIHIKDKNKGKFTESAKAAGESVQEHAKSVLNNPNATALQKKRANFARNAAKWKHSTGGIIKKGLFGMQLQDPPNSAFDELSKKVHGDRNTAGKARQMYYDLKDRGATEAQAAAAVTNAAFETGGTFNPALKSKSGYSGLIQFEPSRNPGNTWNQQINGIHTQMTNPKYWTTGFKIFNLPDSTVYDVTKTFTKGFVRGGNAEGRANTAAKIFHMTNNE